MSNCLLGIFDCEPLSCKNRFVCKGHAHQHHLLHRHEMASHKTNILLAAAAMLTWFLTANSFLASKPGWVPTLKECNGAQNAVVKHVGHVAYEIPLPASISRILCFLCCYCESTRTVDDHLHHLLLCCLMVMKIVKVSKCWLIGKGHMANSVSISLYSLCQRKGMWPEHSEWLSESELMNASEVVQDYLDPVWTFWGHTT